MTTITLPSNSNGWRRWKECSSAKVQNCFGPWTIFRYEQKGAARTRLEDLHGQAVGLKLLYCTVRYVRYGTIYSTIYDIRYTRAKNTEYTKSERSERSIPMKILDCTIRYWYRYGYRTDTVYINGDRVNGRYKSHEISMRPPI